MVACTAAIVSAPVVASRTTMKPATKAASFKAVTVSNGTVKKTTAMQVRMSFDCWGFMPNVCL